MIHERGTTGGFRRVWSQSGYSTGGEIIKFHNRRPIGERRTAGLNPPVRSPFSRGDGGYTAGFGGFGGYDSNASGLQGARGEETRGVEAKLLAVFQLNSSLARENCGKEVSSVADSASPGGIGPNGSWPPSGKLDGGQGTPAQSSQPTGPTLSSAPPVPPPGPSRPRGFRQGAFY